MGACATKPKVEKDAAQAPEPAPEQPAKGEEAVTVAAEVVSEVKPGEKEVVVVFEEEKKVAEREKNIGEGGGDDKEIVGDEKVDDPTTKRQSLSTLLNESEEVNGETTEDVAVKEAKPEIETPVEKAVEETPVVKQPTEEPSVVEESKEVVAEEAPVIAQSSELVSDVKLAETVQPETETPVEQAKQEPLVAENPPEKPEVPSEPTPALPAVTADAPAVVEAENKTADETALEKKPEESK